MREDERSQSGVQVCPNCLLGNDIVTHFCRRCGTPLTSHAAIDPVGRIAAEGDTHRKAIDNSSKPIVLVGMWLLFGPVALGSCGMLAWLLWAVFTRPREFLDVSGAFAALLMFVLAGGSALVFGTMLYRVSRNHVRHRRQRNDKTS